LVPSGALQPRQIVEIKQFLLTARRPDAKSVKIKKTGPVTKFKVRCSKFLYTLCVEDNDKADKLKQSLPPGDLHSSLVPSYFMTQAIAHDPGNCAGTCSRCGKQQNNSGGGSGRSRRAGAKPAVTQLSGSREAGSAVRRPQAAGGRRVARLVVHAATAFEHLLYQI